MYYPRQKKADPEGCSHVIDRIFWKRQTIVVENGSVAASGWWFFTKELTEYHFAFFVFQSTILDETILYFTVVLVIQLCTFVEAQRFA